MKKDRKSVFILVSSAIIVFTATIICFFLDSPKYNDIGVISITASSTDSETSAESKAVNINTANTEELITLYGIGEKRAADIIEYRKKNGKFRTVEELTNISGISKAVLEKNRGKITV